ncbi:hypothetical protein [Blastomonas sp.]|uniref:hypothetical protein n=1 Tax=Blastomonas sp. TaxID=1909299 RepID=UPI00391D3B3A
MSENQEMRVAFVTLLTTQMRFNVATTKVLGKLVGKQQVEPEDVDDLVKYLKLSMDRSEDIIALMRSSSDDS